LLDAELARPRAESYTLDSELQGPAVAGENMRSVPALLLFPWDSMHALLIQLRRADCHQRPESFWGRGVGFVRCGADENRDAS